MRAKKKMTEQEYFELLKSRIPKIPETDDDAIYEAHCQAQERAWDDLWMAVDRFRREHPEVYSAFGS